MRWSMVVTVGVACLEGEKFTDIVLVELCCGVMCGTLN
jgi:hypothetical protein